MSMGHDTSGELVARGGEVFVDQGLHGFLSVVLRPDLSIKQYCV